MTDKRSLRIVVASPSDVRKERESLQQAIDELNSSVGVVLRVNLELSRWETDSYPSFHLEGPQAHIESILRIEDCDVLACIFGRRFGTPTKHAKSGTESEFLRAYHSWKQTNKPQIMMYFKKGNFDPTNDEEEKQWNALQSFRRNFPPEGLYWEFGSTREFHEIVKRHLASLLSQSPRAILYRVPLSSLSAQSKNSFQKYYDESSGEYRIRVTEPLRRPGSDLKLPLGNFDFEVIARKVSGSNGSWYGVYVVQGRGSDSVKYHDFFVSGRGTYTYEIKTMETDESAQKDLEIIESSRLAFSVKAGDSSNRIRLVRRESIMEFWVNEERLLELQTSLARLEEVQVGIAVHTERHLPPGDDIDVAFKEWIFLKP